MVAEGSSAQSGRKTVDDAEVERFSRLAATWWDPDGSMAMLHRLNPLRLAFIRDAACRRFARDPRRLPCLDGIRILDIGCGGGLLCEPLARIGAAMVGADPSAANIAAAQRHGAAAGIAVDYRATTAQALAAAGERFEVVLAMEVVEHVPDVARFVRCCSDMVKPGGLMIAATLNRTLKSFALAIIGAEYVMGWLPRGTHQWERFVAPDQLESVFKMAGLSVVETVGVVYRPLAGRFDLSTDTNVNYMMTAEKAL